jgi:hypothetical protein
MNKLEYRTLWEDIRKVPIGDLERAAEFYSQSPDGQYDNIAELCISAVIAQILMDQRAGR